MPHCHQQQHQLSALPQPSAAPLPPPKNTNMVVEATPEELLDFLIDSARYGDTEDVILAIKEGVQVDGQDSTGRTGGAGTVLPCQ